MDEISQNTKLVISDNDTLINGKSPSEMMMDIDHCTEMIDWTENQTEVVSTFPDVNDAEEEDQNPEDLPRKNNSYKNAALTSAFRRSPPVVSSGVQIPILQPR